MHTPVRKTLQNKQFDHWFQLKITADGENFIGPGWVELLEHIIETGSINQAAKKMGMSYKKAWEMVNAMNLITVEPIVITQTGGEKGGGTFVTDSGKALIKKFKLFYQKMKEVADEQLTQFLDESSP